VAIEMKRYFKQDFRRIGHATRVARYAEQIAREEKADLAVVLSAAYLHDIGIPQAERLYQSTAPKHQEELGPPVAREILGRLGAGAALTEEVCDIVGHHHHPRAEETANFKSVYDADLLVNLQESHEKEGAADPARLQAVIEGSFLTRSGRELARGVLLGRRE
jgi:putative nucleotidyltransferase with HDIG domain